MWPPFLVSASTLGRPAGGACRSRGCSPGSAARPCRSTGGEVRRLVALVEVWVPPGLDEVVLRVGQGLLAFGTGAHACSACLVNPSMFGDKRERVPAFPL